MTTWFSITAAATTLTLAPDRTATAVFTVANESGAAIRGDARIVSVPDVVATWCTIDTPSRTFPVDHTEQLLVTVRVPPGAPPGPVRFRLRMLLGGGVPEEQFDDGPDVAFDVPQTPVVVPPPRRPWWIVAVIIAVILVVVAIGGFVALRGGPGPSPSPTPPPTPSPTPPGVPDLTAAIRVSGGFPVRQAVLSVRNVGTGDVTTLFVARVRRIDGFGGTTEFIATVDRLAAGESTTIGEAPLPLTGEIVLIVDEDDRVAESDETNNIAVAR